MSMPQSAMKAKSAVSAGTRFHAWSMPQTSTSLRAQYTAAPKSSGVVAESVPGRNMPAKFLASPCCRKIALRVRIGTSVRCSFTTRCSAIMSRGSTPTRIVQT
ncbi:MAG: hypothetical protein ACYDIE_00765 [Candidatus Krumholzibacteriia bacterium]